MGLVTAEVARRCWGASVIVLRTAKKRKERVAENITSSDPVNPVPEVFGIYVLFAFSPIK